MTPFLPTRKVAPALCHLSPLYESLMQGLHRPSRIFQVLELAT